MFKYRRVFRSVWIWGVVVLSLVALTACNNNAEESVITTGSPGGVYYSVGNSIMKHLAEANVAKLIPTDKRTGGSKINRERLLSDEAQFGLLQNDTQTSTEIRAVAPLYPEILHIIHRDDISAGSLKELVINRRIGMGPRTGGTAKIVQILFRSFGIDTTEYTPVFLPYSENVISDSLDVVCYVTGFGNPLVMDMLNNRNGKLFSIDSYQSAGSGSAVDGFTLEYHQARPFIIPKNTYGEFPGQPVLTIAIDALLVAREDVNIDLVHDIAEYLFTHKQILAQENQVMSALTEQFDPSRLNFSLHPGARQYLERDEPSFAERYAELFGVLFSIIITLVGGVSTFARWNAKRRKNRVDVYYERVMDISKRVPNLKSAEECLNAIESLRGLREDAFEQLIDEKLSADESFRIFISLLNDTITDIESRQHFLENGDLVRH